LRSKKSFGFCSPSAAVSSFFIERCIYYSAKLININGEGKL
jgi:hypothetical protein